MVKHLEILSAIWDVFFENGTQTRKKILLSEELDEATREKLKVIIEKRGGQIVTKEDEASHIVYGPPPKSATSEGVFLFKYHQTDLRSTSVHLYSKQSVQ